MRMLLKTKTHLRVMGNSLMKGKQAKQTSHLQRRILTTRLTSLMGNLFLSLSTIKITRKETWVELVLPSRAQLAQLFQRKGEEQTKSENLTL